MTNKDVVVCCVFYMHACMLHCIPSRPNGFECFLSGGEFFWGRKQSSGSFRTYGMRSFLANRCPSFQVVEMIDHDTVNNYSITLQSKDKEHP